MTEVKLEGKVGGQAGAALEPHARSLYDRPGVRMVAVIELAHTERTQPAPDSEKQASVKLRITGMEIPAKEQEGVIREAMRALYLQRTANGTLDESGELELSKETIRLTAGMLTELETARLRAGLQHWYGYARRAVNTPNVTATEALHELKAIADGLNALLDRSAFSGD